VVADSVAREMRRKMKWKRWERGLWRHYYIGFSPPFRIKGFLGTVPAICAAQISPMRQMGRYLGFCATADHVAHLSLPSVAPRRNIADLG